MDSSFELPKFCGRLERSGVVGFFLASLRKVKVGKPTDSRGSPSTHNSRGSFFCPEILLFSYPSTTEAAEKRCLPILWWPREIQIVPPVNGTQSNHSKMGGEFTGTQPKWDPKTVLTTTSSKPSNTQGNKLVSANLVVVLKGFPKKRLF